uniref:Uncharacterized protein n=1 Tax=Cacopsylla melanoneura TaxID=428564 RepID=A0A8D8M6Z5_9HEMI
MSDLYSGLSRRVGTNLQRLWNSSLLVCPLDKYRFEHCRATQRPPVFFTEHEKGTFRNFGMMRQLLLKLLKGNKRTESINRPGNWERIAQAYYYTSSILYSLRKPCQILRNLSFEILILLVFY